MNYPTRRATRYSSRQQQAAIDAASGADLKPLDAIETIIGAIRRYPLVAIAELHFLQEWHDLIHGLLFHPSLPRTLTDIVIEFGNAQYQDLADRFILGDRPVARADLEPIWRFQGWDAPVYEQFLRTVRAVNWMRPPSSRIRVLLGTQPLDVAKVRSAADRAFRHWWQNPPDVHYTSLVEQEVLSKGRRALLIAGGGHVLRGLYADRNIVNVATRLAQRHAGMLFVVDTIAVQPDRPHVVGFADDVAQRLQTTFAGWTRPAIARLPGTWLGATQSFADRTVDAAAARYERQADAILYLGPGDTLTASQANPEIFQWGAYRAQLERINPIVSQIDGQHEDLVAESLQMAQAAPSWWAQFGN